MAQQIITIENLKKTIDAFEKRGAKAFILANDLHGTAHAPSKQLNLYRIPICVDGGFLKDGKTNLSMMMGGIYLVPVNDLSILSDIAKKAYECNTKR